MIDPQSLDLSSLPSEDRTLKATVIRLLNQAIAAREVKG